MSNYVIAKYLRLSFDDAVTDSLSIPNQHSQIDSHIEALDIPNVEVLEFIDNGYTGTNLERPAVQELLDLVQCGRVNCIITKDFSRFSRNAIESGYYIEQVFPLYRIRFISVSDGFDSNDCIDGTGGIEVAFKLLMHEHYSRDLSRKVKSTKRVQMLNGENIVANAIYGYRKNEGGRNYLLSGIVEMDDSFFGGAHAGSKRGRGTDKTPVIFSLSLDQRGRPGYLRAQVVEQVDGRTVRQVANAHIAPDSVLHSDGLPSYNPLSMEGYMHEPEVFDRKEHPEHLKWIHVVISNAKAFIADTYHGLSNIHLQAFLDEYCFRFNRRKWVGQIFTRTISACILADIFTRNQLIMA